MDVKLANKMLLDARGVKDRELGSAVQNLGKAISTQIAATKNLLPAVGQFIHIRDRPFTDDMAPMMEPVFNLRLPPMSLLKCGRQVGKSMTTAAKTIIMSAAIPYLSTLTVTPQFEMTRRFSSNYVRPMIEQSPIAGIMMGRGVENSVLQKTFMNGAIMHFSFAFLDCDRIRGIAADRVHFDEVQDIDTSFIHIIAQVMGRSRYRIQDFSGTPKTMDNTIEKLWRESSRAEWIIQCIHCDHWNVPHVEADALKMIGKNGLICAK